MGVATSFDRIADTTVVIVGRAPELARWLPEAVRVVRMTPDETVDAAPVALLILDARDYPLPLLAKVRASPQLASVPALGIAEHCDDAIADLADDVIVPPLGRDVAARLNVLIELGRTRFALAFAQQALDESASGLTIADTTLPDLPIVFASSVVERITGYAPPELYGRNCRMLQGPDTSEEARATIREALAQGARASVTILNYKKDGAPFWNEVTIFPVRAPDGRRLRWVGGVQHDITGVVEARAEIARLVRELVEKKQFDEAILDGVEAGIVTTDGRARITFANRHAKTLLERTDDWIGADVQQVLALPESPEQIVARRAERRWPHAVRVGDRELELEVAVSAADASSQERLGFFFIFHDRTEEKQLEMERRRFERLAAMGTMVAGFAHEIRNPMASLRSLAESMSEELAEANITLPHVGRMLKVLERVEMLVRSSLLFGRPSPPRRAAHRPWTILSAAVSSLLPRSRQLGGELCIEADPDLPEVFVDETQIVQVLIILLNNAIDTTGSPQRVLLRATYGRSADGGARKSDLPPSPYVRFEVHDDGAGIPAEIMGRIFDPFFTTKAQGTGLGLSIAQQLASENCARIELTSAVGGPTTFTLLVPVVGADAAPVSVG